MSKAIKIATEAFTATLDKIVPGVREKEIANELDYMMRRLGANAPSFETIVASGPRAALPHAHPTDRVIGQGEAVIVDFGCQVDGYCSDETCTVSVGEIGKEIRESLRGRPGCQGEGRAGGTAGFARAGARHDRPGLYRR